MTDTRLAFLEIRTHWIGLYNVVIRFVGKYEFRDKCALTRLVSIADSNNVGPELQLETSWMGMELCAVRFYLISGWSIRPSILNEVIARQNAFIARGREKRKLLFFTKISNFQLGRWVRCGDDHWRCRNKYTIHSTELHFVSSPSECRPNCNVKWM